MVGDRHEGHAPSLTLQLAMFPSVIVGLMAGMVKFWAARRPREDEKLRGASTDAVLLCSWRAARNLAVETEATAEAIAFPCW